MARSAPAEPRPDLRALQRWFLDVVTHPAGVRAGADAAEPRLRIDDVVAPSPALDAERRIGIYAGMYFARLVEVLREDFPALVHLLGPEARGVLERYLVRHPSRHPNLNRLGARLPEWLAREAGDFPPFAVELARLERGIQEVFDAPRAPALAAEHLLGLPRESWGALELPLVPAARLLAFEHPVNDWYGAFRDGDPRPAPAPRPTWLLLHRRDFRVWRVPLAREQHALLAALARGATLGEALDELAQVTDVAALAPHLSGWFREWSRHGLFRARAPAAP